MDIIVKIGRDLANGTKTDINVSKEYKKVSHLHAVITWHGVKKGREGVVTIEDKDTPNGTFVNGRRYARKKILENDTICLGGDTEEDYQLDLKKLFDDFRKMEMEQRTDFSEEFEELKKVNIEWLNEVKKITKIQGWRQRFVMYAIPTVVSMVLGYFVTTSTVYHIVFAALGFVIGMLIDFLDKRDMSEKRMDLKLKYQARYRCPKCGCQFNLETMHWKQLEADGCLNPKCGAKFKKGEA